MIAKFKVGRTGTVLQVKPGDHVFAQRNDYKASEIDTPTLRVLSNDDTRIETQDVALPGKRQFWQTSSGWEDKPRAQWCIVRVIEW